VWLLWGFSDVGVLTVNVKLPNIDGARVSALLGLESSQIYDAELQISGDALSQVARDVGHERCPGTAYFLTYRVDHLPIWDKGTEPLFFWRDGQPAHAAGVLPTDGNETD
jgi:hypothetical protein